MTGGANSTDESQEEEGSPMPRPLYLAKSALDFVANLVHRVLQMTLSLVKFLLN
jgi:hypothetical protein